MNLTKWEPFKELEDMTQRLNRIFGRSLIDRDKGSEALTVAEWAPAVDVSETETEYLIKAEIPEVKKEDVKVTLQDGILTLQGERKQLPGKRLEMCQLSSVGFFAGAACCAPTRTPHLVRVCLTGN